MNQSNKYGDAGITAFLDIVMFLGLFFAMMFIVSIIYMNKKEPDAKKVDIRAEYIITLSWDKEVKSDIDLWLEDPANNLVFYQRKTDGFMALKRDDIGHSDDTVTLPNGDVIKYSENRETITIRKVIPGEYICNVHMFNSNGVKFPIEATVVLHNIREGKEIHRETVVFKRNGEEITAFRFTLGNGVKNINRLEKKYVGVQ